MRDERQAHPLSGVVAEMPDMIAEYTSIDASILLL